MLPPRTTAEIPITGAKLSTVVPGTVRGENVDRELTNMDLAVKFHYIKGVYFFKRITTDTDDKPVIPSDGGITIQELKRPLFELLDWFFPAAGRIRRSDASGHPYIKCNDAGVRIIEAFCEELTVEECLDMVEMGCSFHDRLCYNQVLGPDIGFSPLVLLQFTRFKCGGLSVGLSWAHMLGDIASASMFMNTWAQIMAGHVPKDSMHVTSPKQSKPFSVEELDPPPENHWSLPANIGQNMRTRCFKVSAKQLNLLMSNTCGKKAANFSRFEILSAVIWKSLSQIRKNSSSKVVTICWYKYPRGDKYRIPNNKSMVLSTVERDSEVNNVSELAFLIAERKIGEDKAVKEMVGKVDYLVYGANLTLVNLEDVEIYELQMIGQKPIFANFSIEGVGNEGLVLVHSGGPKNGKDDDINGRVVTVVLPEDELAHLENELKANWNIA
ncbi:protein ECERIFERUM 2 [Humulus lupulus]|uniref:protein ECERIFERUM 2 n=1 Tax=Humulus lupulus TaxID=3486 RepID=UPI002B40D421|nr:protein ECERIFERUM 2 [Humulus lupulus]